MQINELIDEIIKRRKNSLSQKINHYQRKNSILSDIGECNRQLVYNVLDWDKRPLHDEELQARFDVGNLWEREVIRTLQELGFDFILSQSPVAIKNRNGELIATGKIDGFIQHDKQRFAVEIKSMNPNIFNQVKSLEDFQKKPWLRKYLRQLTLYLLANNQEWGLFILVDGMGHWKMIPLALDYGEAEFIIQRLETVHEFIKKKEYPDRIVYDTSICDRCPFALICLQDINKTPAELIIDDAVEQAVARHEELKPLAKEFDEIHDEIKEKFKNVAKAIIGDKFIVQNIASKRTAYELTPEAEEQVAAIKKEFAKQVPVLRLVIQALDKKEGGQ